ncbi:MAG: glycosyltransferase family 4 protein, partial [Scytonema sp. PMC 1069.18]|nr:glycosyltransferase family 4 protein [Scytonema sp. PMC 1069.18]
VISFLDTTNIVTLLALTSTNYPVLLSEQNNPRTNSKGKMWDYLRFLTYPIAAKVISTSQGVDSYFDWLPKSKRAVIYNPLATVEDGKTFDFTQGVDADKKWIIAMGRLTYQKGFDILLQAFHQIVNKYPNWQLIILGEGQLRSELENLRDDLGLNHQVILPGVIKNPFPLLKKSHIFVLSSRFEGFGNVLIEAMACGLPVISTDCPSGPREIIRDGIDGILVPNEDISALASAMDRLMSDEQERQCLASHAPEGVTRFNLEKIVEMWEVLFSEFLHKKVK